MLVFFFFLHTNTLKGIKSTFLLIRNSKPCECAAMVMPLGGKPTAAALVVWLHVCMCTASKIQLTFMTPAYIHACFIRVRICLSSFMLELSGMAGFRNFYFCWLLRGIFRALVFVSCTESAAQLLVNILHFFWNEKGAIIQPQWLLKKDNSGTLFRPSGRIHTYVFLICFSLRQLLFVFADICIWFWMNEQL